MKITRFLSLAILCLCLHACNGTADHEEIKEDKMALKPPSNSDTANNKSIADKKSAIKDDPFIARLIKEQDAIKLMGAQCTYAPVKDQESEVYQYAFKLDLVKIQDSDNWYFHKAYDAAMNVVCFVLVVKHSGDAAPEYFRGNVPCPKVCGFADDFDLEKCLKQFLDRSINFKKIDEGVAQKLIDNQRDGYVYTLPVEWGPALEDIMDRQQNAEATYCVLIYADPNPPHDRPAVNASMLVPYDKVGHSYDAKWEITDSKNLCRKAADGAPCTLLP